MEVDLRARLISGFSGRQVSAGGEQVDSEFGKGHWGPEVADCRDYHGRGTHTPLEKLMPRHGTCSGVSEGGGQRQWEGCGWGLLSQTCGLTEGRGGGREKSE